MATYGSERRVTGSVECGLSGSDVPMGNQSAHERDDGPWCDDMFEIPAADVGMASFCNFPTIEFAVVTSRAATDTAGTPPVARVLI
jgi:hypothetical protein